MANWRDATLREVEKALEADMEFALRLERDAPAGSRSKTVADMRYRQDASALLSLRRVVALMLGNGMLPPRIEITIDLETPEEAPEAVSEDPAGRFHRDPCPWCGDPVSVDEKPFWTCPADVRRNAPGWLKPKSRKVPELSRVRAIPSYCGRKYGLVCYADVPAHEDCHKRG